VLLLTVGLILVGFVLLLIGLLADVYALVYLAIGCAMAAGLVLLVYSRLSRRQAAPVAAAPGAPAGQGAPAPATRPWTPPPAPPRPEPTAAPAWTPPPPPEPTVTLGAVESERGPDTEVAPVVVGTIPRPEDEVMFPIADYDELRVSEILPLLPELDLDELDVVRARELAGKRRSAVIDRIDDLIDELEAEEPPVAVPSAPMPSGDGFPIADYENRSVEEIVAIIPDLSDDELDLLAELEEQGQNRAAVLDAIDDQFEEVEISDDELAVPAPVAPVKKVPAKKAPAKKVSAKKVSAKKVPVKKVAAKKAPTRVAVKAVKKAPKKAPVKRVPVKAAKKASARKASVKKIAAKKTLAKKAGVKRAPARKVAKVTAKRAATKKAPARRATVTKVVKKVGRPAKKR
jgi:hypothetical protein